MKKRDNVKFLDDGRMEITLLIPLRFLEYKKWIKFYLPDSELIIRDAKIIAVRCSIESWETVHKYP